MSFPPITLSRLLYCSVVLVINGVDAIYDALVRHSDAFSSKDSVWIEKNITNRDQRG